MEYVEINTGPWDDRPDSWWVRLLRRVVPAENPDFEETLYPHTRIWWIELDDDRIPQREIGFNQEGEAIVLGPVGRNHGFAVDESAPWASTDGQSEEASRRFQKTWDDIWPRFAHLGGYQPDIVCWAYCMFSSPTDFAAIHEAAGEACDYASMKAEVRSDLATNGSFLGIDIDLSWLEWPDINLSSVFDWFEFS